MKKRLVTSYLAGVCDQAHGESYWTILTYFVPEFISSLVLFLSIIDAQWVSLLKSTAMYATVGTTNTLLHFIFKLAEGFCVGTIIMTGHFNGLDDFKQAGRTLVDAFWVTVIAGLLVSGFLFFGAYWIFYYYGVPTKMIALGVPYLRLKAVSIFFMFIYFAVIGFLRGIKKPRIPMQIFLVGAILYLFFDYALIFGKYGFPEMQLQGSAIASVIQYVVMVIASFGYIFFNQENRKYSIRLFSPIQDWRRIKELFTLMAPVMIDKGTLAAAYIWLGYMINPMGTYVIASLTAIKDLERLAILPAAAFANVITFLVSNAYGRHDWEGIKTNIKKTVLLSSIFVFSILLVFSLWPEYFISVFDHKSKFTAFSARIFPALSVLVFFDLLQLILSGALRGAANVNAVMWVRLAVCVFYFAPMSWVLAHWPFESLTIKFLLVYSSFYIGSALMSVIYVYRFRGERWQRKTI